MNLKKASRFLVQRCLVAHSQGATHDEALANIREAIQLWLEVAEEVARREAEAEGLKFARELVAV